MSPTLDAAAITYVKGKWLKNAAIMATAPAADKGKQACNKCHKLTSSNVLEKRLVVFDMRSFYQTSIKVLRG